MKRVTTVLTAALAVLALSTALVYAQAGGTFDLSWATIDVGGAPPVVRYAVPSAQAARSSWAGR